MERVEQLLACLIRNRRWTDIDKCFEIGTSEEQRDGHGGNICFLGNTDAFRPLIEHTFYYSLCEMVTLKKSTFEEKGKTQNVVELSKHHVFVK